MFRKEIEVIKEVSIFLLQLLSLLLKNISYSLPKWSRKSEKKHLPLLSPKTWA